MTVANDARAGVLPPDPRPDPIPAPPEPRPDPAPLPPRPQPVPVPVDQPVPAHGR